MNTIKTNDKKLRFKMTDHESDENKEYIHNKDDKEN